MKSKRKAKDAWDKWYKNATIQNLWDAVKAVIRKKSICRDTGLTQNTKISKQEKPNPLHRRINKKKRTNKIKSQ